MSFLDDAAEIGVKAISFVSDGESTCSPYLYDSILRGRQNGLDMALGTNGFLLDRDKLGLILPSLVYLRFNISATGDEYSRVMGCKPNCYDTVIGTIKAAVQIKKSNNLKTTIGLQMVLLPELIDQVLPLAALGKRLGVDYLVIKHCSDDETGALRVDYSKYTEMSDVLTVAEAMSTKDYLVKAKWSKILSGGKRNYSACYGAPFLLQMSGSGLVAPCGCFFGEKYKQYWIGNIQDTRFKTIWQSERYWDVMRFITGPNFDARTMCGSLCVQHKVNEFLDTLVNNKPDHINFI
jgi:MoaA/NifB/PqqE/SkfB family radical SAM enzyme